ncbi:hypothetical protein FACS189449_00090 [Alphaproteobacteria bacterium]|nr:hypothetical protein FACS189449_00090 [Alphaproteobacteria bacterium]
MSNKPGRNELCHCGSGKKYKKCCLAADVSVGVRTIAADDSKWYKLRCTEGRLMDNHLVPYATHVLPDAVVKTALEEFMQKELPKDLDQELVFEYFFLPWCLFNWIPVDDFGIKDFDGQETLAENYLRLNRDRLTSKERLFIETIIHSYYSFYCVLDVELDKSLTVKDILLETTHIVKERQGTHQLTRGSVVYGRILTMEDQSIFVGMAPFRMNPDVLHGLIDFRQALVKENGGRALSGEVLRNDFDLILLDHYFDLIINAFNKPFPTFMNTDGEPIVFIKSSFKLMMDPEDALGRLLLLTLGAKLDDLLEEAERDESGNVTKVEFCWLKDENGRGKIGDNTILGYILIEKDTLTLDTNSRERAKLGEELLTKYLGDKISLQTSTMETPEQKARALEESGDVDEDGDDDDDDDEDSCEISEESPEMDAMIKDMVDEHWKNWFDEPIPLLGDKTPRQAAKTKEGKEKLEALLMEYDYRDRGSDNPYKPDIEYLREELHLDS